MGGGLNLDAWWDDPAYKRAQGSFSTKGAFILRKFAERDGASSRPCFMTCTAATGLTRWALPSSNGRPSWRTWAPARRRSLTCRTGSDECGGEVS